MGKVKLDPRAKLIQDQMRKAKSLLDLAYINLEELEAGTTGLTDDFEVALQDLEEILTRVGLHLDNQYSEYLPAGLMQGHSGDYIEV